MTEDESGYPCPYCRRRRLETVATLPYVRGFLVAYQIGTKRFVGCTSCVRVAIYKEVGLSALVGWFSITALVINPFLLVYGATRGLFVSRDPEGVRKVLAQAGLPALPCSSVDPLKVAYGLAAAMIAADGKVEPEEVDVAAQIGARLFQGFDREVLLATVEKHRDLPPPAQLAALLRDALDDRGKEAVYNYLEAIAGADGEVAEAERDLLVAVQDRLGLPVAA